MVAPGRLFLAFLRLGLTAFGGPAMVAYIRDLAVKKNPWISEQSFQQGVALCQSIPGATAMQTAAYTGLRAGGVLGALAAFVGFGLPSFVLMLALSVVYGWTHEVGVVISTFRGLHLVVVAVVASAAVHFGRSSVRGWRDALVAGGAGAFLALGGSPVVVIGAAAALGLVLHAGGDATGTPHGAGAFEGGRSRRLFVAILAVSAAAALAALFLLDPRLFELARMMVQVDLLAFGGGFASVPLMLHRVVEVRHWMDSRTFMDGIALGQVTPGPIVITATFVGYRVAGLAGAVVGTLAIFSPSFLMVLLTVPWLDRMQGSPLFRRALRGVLASFVGLLLAVTLKFALAIDWTIPGAVVAGAAFLALRLKVDILWVVLAGAGVCVLVL